MGAKLIFEYDRHGDILYVSTRSPYAEQESEELADGIVARLNPATGGIENLEILLFSSWVEGEKSFELPVSADLRLAARP
jgi:hypothetical protein